MPWIFDKDVESDTPKKQEVLALAYFKNIHTHVVHRGFTNLASVDGRHRSGKSVWAILMAYLLDATFWGAFDKRVVSTPDEYVAAVMDIRDKGIKGACIVVDEAGVSMAASDFYESFMKTISKMIQMYGYLCIQTFFCAPNKDFVDSRLRRMFHSYYRVERFSNEYSIVFPYTIKYSSMVHKWFYRHPVINYQGERIIMNRIKFMKPPQFIIDRYQAFADSHKDKMLDEFMVELHNQKMQAARKIVNIEDLLKSITNDPKPHLKTSCGEGEYYFDIDRIAHNLKIGHKLAQSLKFDAEAHFQAQAKLNPPAPKPVAVAGEINVFKRKRGRPLGSRKKDDL